MIANSRQNLSNNIYQLPLTPQHDDITPLPSQLNEMQTSSPLVQKTEEEQTRSRGSLDSSTKSQSIPISFLVRMCMSFQERGKESFQSATDGSSKKERAFVALVLLLTLGVGERPISVVEFSRIVVY